MSLTKVSYSMIQGEVVNVLDYGAVGDGVADDTAAFNSALAYIKAQSRSGVLYVPKCSNFYSVSSINATGFSFEIGNYLTIRGESYGSLIRGNTTGVAVLDCVGSSNIHLQDLVIGTQGVSAQCGLLLSRTTVNTSSNGGVFQNIVMQGDFSIAACVSIGAEGSRWYAPLFQNTGSSGTFKRCGFYTTSENTLGATSLYATLLTGNSQAPNTDNSMYGPHFQAEIVANNSSPVVIENGGQWSFYSALVLTVGNTKNNMVTYIPNTVDNIFLGSIIWYSPLFESASYTAHYIKGYGTFTDCVVQGISTYNGYMNTFDFTTVPFFAGLAGTTYNFSRCNVENLRTNPNVVPLIYADSFAQSKLSGTPVQFFIPPSGFIQDLTIFSANAFSEYGAQSFGVPIQTAGTSPPGTGYYPKNAIRWNSDPVAAGFVGWVCTVAGSPGTWKTFGAISA